MKMALRGKGGTEAAERSQRESGLWSLDAAATRRVSSLRIMRACDVELRKAPGKLSLDSH